MVVDISFKINLMILRSLLKSSEPISLKAENLQPQKILT